jgi:hypothetical protein
MAVPVWIEEVRLWTADRRTQRSVACMLEIAEHGDIILYRSDVAGESADAFNRLAEGLAILSFAPGGVRFAGRHWLSDPAAGVPA